MNINLADGRPRHVLVHDGGISCAINARTHRTRRSVAGGGQLMDTNRRAVTITKNNKLYDCYDFSRIPDGGGRGGRAGDVSSSHQLAKSGEWF